MKQGSSECLFPQQFSRAKSWHVSSRGLVCERLSTQLFEQFDVKAGVAAPLNVSQVRAQAQVRARQRKERQRGITMVLGVIWHLPHQEPNGPDRVGRARVAQHVGAL